MTNQRDYILVVNDRLHCFPLIYLSVTPPRVADTASVKCHITSLRDVNLDVRLIPCLRCRMCIKGVLPIMQPPQSHL